MGFVSKRRARDLLLSQRPGTFLLRFSEAQLGGISMVYSCTNEFGESADVQRITTVLKHIFCILCYWSTL